DRAVGTLQSANDVVVVAHQPAAGEGRFLLEVDPDARLATGDRLIVYGDPHQLSPLMADVAPNDAELRWANWFKRTGRGVFRTVAEMDVPVLVCTIVLFVVLFISTLVLHFGVRKYGVADALLRTVSIMATGAPLHEEEYPDSPPLRVYVSILRIVGVVLMAAFTAIVTNYL